MLKDTLNNVRIENEVPLITPDEITVRKSNS